MTARSTSLSTSPSAAKNASALRFSSRRMNAEISGGVNSRLPRPIRTTLPVSPPTRNGKCSASCRTSSRPLPMKRFEHGAVAGGIPARRQLLELCLVRDALGLDRLPRALEPALPRFGRRAALPLPAHLVELLVEREHFFQQPSGHLLRRLLRPLGRQPLELQQVVDPGNRVAEGAIRVVQVRRFLEGRAWFCRGWAAEVWWM